MLSVNHNPTSAELRTFGRVMLGGLGLIGLILWYLGVKPHGSWSPSSFAWHGVTQHYIAVALWLTGTAIFVLTLISLSAARSVYVAWMTIAMWVGTVVTTVLLSVLFFLLLPVFSLIRFKDPLRLKLGTQQSYWEDHKVEEISLERMRRIF